MTRPQSVFQYRAAASDGRMVSGWLSASSEPHAIALLLERGLHAVGLERTSEGVRAGRSLRPRDLAIVFRSIAAIVAAGAPLERALAASQELARGPLRGILADTRVLLVEGRSFSEALDAASRGAIPPVVVGMIRAGERGSRLTTALEQVAAQLEREADLAGQLRQALAYPAMLLGVGGVSLLVITTVVLPRFAELIEDAGSTLPASANALLAMSRFAAQHGVPLAAGVAALAACLARWSRRPEARHLISRTALALPLVGPVRRSLAAARWGRSLGAMLESGLPLLTALQAANEAAADPATVERLGRARERVAQGERLSSALREADAVPAAAAQLVAVGESSGQLGSMAQRAGDIAALDAERGLKALTSLVEPVLVIGFGGAIAFVAAALLQALYSLRPAAP